MPIAATVPDERSMKVDAEICCGAPNSSTFA